MLDFQSFGFKPFNLMNNININHLVSHDCHMTIFDSLILPI